LGEDVRAPVDPKRVVRKTETMPEPDLAFISELPCNRSHDHDLPDLGGQYGIASS